jgi:hypothetical protein
MSRALLSIVPALLCIAGSAVARQAEPAKSAEPGATTEAAPSNSTVSDRATFMFGKERMHEDGAIGSNGFLDGLRGFEHFYNPVGNPLYFETPLIQTSARLLYLYHQFDDDSQLQGGDLTVLAVQARVALTERLAFIATKDGYSFLEAGALPEEEGWNDVALGMKWAFFVDREADFVLTGGARVMLPVGDRDVLQNDVTEISPFLTMAKGFGKLHLMANITDRIPTNDDAGNNVLQWDAHVDYELFDGFAPIFEVHGLHYLSDGTRTPLSVGGGDYTNLGSTDVDGSYVIWGGFGARFKFSPHASLGFTYEIPFTDPEDDIFGDRITVDFELTW